MYFYIIEKKINMETFTNDIQLIQNCLSNSSEIHSLLGKLFNVDNIENWREKNNILYKFVNNGSFKLLIKSDIKINEKKLEDFNFTLLKKLIINIEENSILNFSIIVSPTTKIDNKRVVLRNQEDRINWLKNKLTYNKECEILNIYETSQKQYNMKHKNIKKGSSLLFGYEYNIKARINSKTNFEKLIKKGIGPEKCYGFGLIDYVSHYC